MVYFCDHRVTQMIRQLITQLFLFAIFFMVLAWIFKSFGRLKKFYFLFHFIYWFISKIKEFMSLSRTDLFLIWPSVFHKTILFLTHLKILPLIKILSFFRSMTMRTYLNSCLWTFFLSEDHNHFFIHSYYY